MGPSIVIDGDRLLSAGVAADLGASMGPSIVIDGDVALQTERGDVVLLQWGRRS